MCAGKGGAGGGRRYLEAGVQVAEGGELARAARAQAQRGARAHAALVHVRHGRPAAEAAHTHTLYIRTYTLLTIPHYGEAKRKGDSFDNSHGGVTGDFMNIHDDTATKKARVRFTNFFS